MKNLGNLMKQAQQMQQKMADLQQKMAEMEMAGAAGAGLVSVVVNGKGEMKKVTLDPKVVDPSDIEMLEDLIVAAHNDAKVKVEAAMQTEMQAITGGLQLPPGMKLPF